MVTMVLMVVITLIVLGFAEISRSEQRNTLDTQLSAQAYYAAESGVNDARSAIVAKLSTGTTIPNKTTCGTDPNYPTLASPNNVIDLAHGVSYTCVLINTGVPTLIYQISHTATVAPLISSDNSPFGTLTLSWSPGAGLPKSTANCPNTAGQYPPAVQWTCNYPVLRIDLVSVDNTKPISRNNWANITETMFLTPVAGIGPSNINLGSGGFAGTVPCNAGTGTCDVDINGVSTSTLYMRVSTLYRDNSQLTISTTKNKTFSGAQATIDSTGKAQDVLRRIRVAIDLSNNSASPIAAITSNDSICKRFEVTNGWFEVPSDPNLNNATGSDGDSLCAPQIFGIQPQP